MTLGMEDGEFLLTRSWNVLEGPSGGGVCQAAGYDGLNPARGVGLQTQVHQGDAALQGIVSTLGADVFT